MTRDAVETELRDLSHRVAQLEAELAFLKRHRTLAKGVGGEVIVSGLVDGRLTAYAAGHDVETPSGHRVEVKHASLSRPVRTAKTLRWQWAKIFGESGKKQYDFLVLLGDADERYRPLYKDPDAPFVMFAVPFSELADLKSSGQREGYRAILLNSNPLGPKRQAAQRLFNDFQTTERELNDRFGL